MQLITSHSKTLQYFTQTLQIRVISKENEGDINVALRIIPRQGVTRSLFVRNNVHAYLLDRYRINEYHTVSYRYVR